MLRRSVSALEIERGGSHNYRSVACFFCRTFTYIKEKVRGLLGAGADQDKEKDKEDDEKGAGKARLVRAGGADAAWDETVVVGASVTAALQTFENFISRVRLSHGMASAPTSPDRQHRAGRGTNGTETWARTEA